MGFAERGICRFQGCREIAIWAIETAQCLLRVKCPAKWGRCCLVTIYNHVQYVQLVLSDIRSQTESWRLWVLVLPFSAYSLDYFSRFWCSMRKCKLYSVCLSRLSQNVELVICLQFLSPGKSFPCTSEEYERWGSIRHSRLCNRDRLSLSC